MTKQHATPPAKAAAPNSLRDAFEDVSRLFQSGDLRNANNNIERLLADYPDNVNFLHLGGLIKQSVGEYELAEKMLATAYTLHPEQLDITHNLAVFFLSRGKLDQAIPLYEALLSKVSHQAHLWVNYGHALRQQGKLAKALEAFEKAAAQEPEKFEIQAVMAMTRRQLALWDGPVLPPEKVNAALAPIFIEDPFEHLAIVRKAAANIKPVALYEAQAIPGQARMRVGYLSNDLHDHATSHLIAELFALHDRTRFEVFVYSYGSEDHSPVRQRMKLAAEHWVECRDRNPAFIADRIFRDRINILVDLKGYTRGGMPEVLASRPANVNLEWLGYPGSTGADFVDYMVVDSTLVPESLRGAYSEKLLFMPHSYQINDRQRSLAASKSRADYGLPENAVVLGCFCQTYKITPAVFDVWMRVMRDNPQTVLWLFAAHEDAIANLCGEAARKGVDTSRLVFATRMPPDQHLARYRAMDFALDTSPYGGHTTTSDALWAGTPVVGLMGKSFAARVSSSLLKAAGMEDCITHTVGDYEAKIRSLIADPQEVGRLKAQLASGHDRLPLFDTPAFVKAFENGLAQIWQAAQEKQEKKDIHA